MRNNKTMLRYSRNSALLFAAASGLAYLTACSSDVTAGGDQNIPEPSAENGSYTVYGANPNRVHNFGNEGTRAAADFTMPECPTVPSDAAPTTGLWGWEINQLSASNIVIPEGTTLTEAFNVKAGKNYYVAGTWDIPSLWGVEEGAVIWVLPGGTFKVGGTLQPGLTIFNYGTLASEGLTVAEGTTIYSAVDITEVKTFGINGANNGKEAGKLYCKGTLDVPGEIRLNGEAAACAFISETEIDIHSDGTVKAGYFKANDLTMNSGNVVLDNNGLIDVVNLNLSNAETRMTVEGTNAVAHAEKFNTNNVTWAKNTFAPEIAIDFEKCYIAGTETDHNEFGFQVSDSDQVVYVPAAGCHGEFGQKPSEDTTSGAEENPDEETITVPEIVKVTEIDPLDEEINHGNHDHGVISATCIQFGADGTAYASYHLRGEGQKGCIEVIKDNGANGLTLSSYMISPDYDFNHLMVDGDKIITVGNHVKKAAFVGMLPTNFEASEGVRSDFYVKELTTDEKIYSDEASIDRPGEKQAIGYKNAGDGNCIVKYGDNYLFTSYRGYGAITADSLKKVPGTFHATSGSSKHIALSGNKAVVLSHDTYDNTSSTASVESWTLGDGSFASVLAKYDAIGTISPVDGKNVVAIDGEDIYACLSHGGVARIRGGQVETKTFGKGDTDAKYAGVPVNGMAIDNDYLYLAAGAFVIVLEKETMEEVCHYYAESTKSANYIALNNGKIYVAYGEDGIMAFQLKHKTIEL